METIVACCAGLDVHQATVVACVITSSTGKRPKNEIRTFGTMHHELMQLREWLTLCGCSLVAMESTGVYWRPVFEMLEDYFDIIVGNAQHIKNVPGRKTDVKDSEWICDLARHGLIARSFVPPRAIRDLRDLTRYRRKLVEAASAERNRMIRMLESAGIKLAGIASDVFGVSGRAMLRALIEGDQSPAEMAKLARGRMRRKLTELEQALRGNVDEHHRFMLRLQFGRILVAEADLTSLEARIEEKLIPYEDALSLLLGIPGLDRVGSASVIAEIGIDMSQFHGAAHLASWACICPGNYESAGRRRGGKTRKGNVFLKTALVTAAIAASKTRGTYYAEKYRRLCARRGKLRAAVAVGHSILVAIYHMLANGTVHQDPGPEFLDNLDKRRTSKQLVRRLNSMGFDVQLTPIAA